MIPDFAGRTIDIARIDWSLHLWTDDNWELILSQPVLVTSTTDGEIRQELVEVDVEPQPLPPSLEGIEGSTLLSVVVARQGHLALVLPDRQLVVAPSPRYEAWQIAGHDGERLICKWGGTLEHYPPRRGTPSS